MLPGVLHAPDAYKAPTENRGSSRSQEVEDRTATPSSRPSSTVDQEEEAFHSGAVFDERRGLRSALRGQLHDLDPPATTALDVKEMLSEAGRRLSGADGGEVSAPAAVRRLQQEEEDEGHLPTFNAFQELRRVEGQFPGQRHDFFPQQLHLDPEGERALPAASQEYCDDWRGGPPSKSTTAAAAEGDFWGLLCSRADAGCGLASRASPWKAGSCSSSAADCGVSGCPRPGALAEVARGYAYFQSPAPPARPAAVSEVEALQLAYSLPPQQQRVEEQDRPRRLPVRGPSLDNAPKAEAVPFQITSLVRRPLMSSAAMRPRRGPSAPPPQQSPRSGQAPCSAADSKSGDTEDQASQHSSPSGGADVSSKASGQQRRRGSSSSSCTLEDVPSDQECPPRKPPPAADSMSPLTWSAREETMRTRKPMSLRMHLGGSGRGSPCRSDRLGSRSPRIHRSTAVPDEPPEWNGSHTPSASSSSIPQWEAPRPPSAKLPTDGFGECIRSAREFGGRGSGIDSLPEEEVEWLKRQRLTGAIARVVQYDSPELPDEDILGLRRTSAGRMLVTGIREAGPAAIAGVVPGDQLISVDGEKDFASYTALFLHRRIRRASTLVFVGFVGRLQAEVRVKQPDRVRCGLSAETVVLDHTRAASDSAVVQLCDAVVFQKSSESMLIAMDDEEAASLQSLWGLMGPLLADSNEDPSAAEASKTADKLRRAYELQRQDAKYLVQRALLGPVDSDEVNLSI
eukprot:TRINITY_DN31750_c0_g1_i1.p1 TRINITY_DN31750_c0_g1~~TRINITY_DN31750_c0_g1_i1.p1  ORF type:complete len:740 (-),score=127.20 TRINITY_DN31750_c0_g1_i1:427-2646(-)